VRLKAVHAVPALALAAGFSLALGGGGLSEHGPLPSYTGAPAIRSKPAELDCTLCHFNFEWNNLNTPAGAVEILDLPATYTAGQTYRIRVRISTDSTAAYPDRDWGFQLTAVRASDGEGCGTFLPDDPDTLQIVSGADGGFPVELASRRYVQHTILGDRDGIASPVEWTFSWRAPDAPEDTALFYCAGNATNGNLGPDGDFIFTAAETVLDLTTPVKPVSWGAVKRRYRN
jgi:hypothetical protein